MDYKLDMMMVVLRRKLFYMTVLFYFQPILDVVIYTVKLTEGIGAQVCSI